MSRFLNPQFRFLTAYVPGEQPREGSVLKLNTNESPYPPAPAVAAAITEQEINDLRLYSDPTGRDLKEKLAGLYGVAPEQIFLSNGSDEALNFAFMAFGGKGVLFPDITYGFYEVYAQLYGIPARKIPLREDFSLNYRDYCGKQQMIVIANPNAPTGLSIPAKHVEEILKSNPYSLVVIDEAYVDFGGETCLPLLKTYDNLLITRTFSKSRCLAGGRLGYAFGSRAIIADLEKIKYSTNPYNLDRLTLRLGEATIDQEIYYRQKCAEVIRTREWTRWQLLGLGFTVLPSSTNFLFAKSSKMDGQELYEKLKARGILVRHFGAKRICQFNRITVGTMEQMKAFIAATREILGGSL